MVALDILPGVEVWVEVSGQPLQEYEDQGDHPDQENSVTRFIAAESDQYFGIGIQAKDTQGWEGEGLSVQVDIDGSRSKGFLVLKKQLKGKPKRMVNLGLNLPDGKMANYKFSALNLDTGMCFHRATRARVIKLRPCRRRRWTIGWGEQETLEGRIHRSASSQHHERREQRARAAQDLDGS